MNILQLLNKIKWDKKEDAEDYILIYLDEVAHQEKEQDYVDVMKIENNFLFLNSGKQIPLHKIRKVLKQGKVIWER